MAFNLEGMKEMVTKKLVKKWGKILTPDSPYYEQQQKELQAAIDAEFDKTVKKMEKLSKKGIV